MPATADELAYARVWIGQVETEAEFNARFDRLINTIEDRDTALNAAIEEAIRARLSVLTMDQPSQISLGSISMAFNTNITELEKILADFTSSKGTRPYRVTQLEREDSR